MPIASQLQQEDTQLGPGARSDRERGGRAQVPCLQDCQIRIHREEARDTEDIEFGGVVERGSCKLSNLAVIVSAIVDQDQ